MDDDEIKRSIESPLNADDHISPIADDLAPEDDLDDDLGREIDGGISMHPHDDTDGDITERYMEEEVPADSLEDLEDPFDEEADDDDDEV